ncbi:GbsR/MarR family transcriptional regulator [Oceanicola sp. S124]|uniref:GbsR/MarR family transcriptional regulator n=1 Tax=Oceanicola sp. S124 TaxID=1042378 RepID=UPI00025599DA|nr:MarR family transcriptional regulator [Oceanicola sp. S124]
MAELSRAMQGVILHWGEMGNRWGLNRSAAQILALLHLWPEPLSAGEISATLGLARSNVSAGLKELQSWRVIELSRRLGDRKDYFTSPRDMDDLARAIARARREREMVPALDVLETLLEAAAGDGTPPRIRDRMAATAATLTRLDAVMLQLGELPAAQQAQMVELGEDLADLLTPEQDDAAQPRADKPKKKKKKTA